MGLESIEALELIYTDRILAVSATMGAGYVDHFIDLFYEHHPVTMSDVLMNPSIFEIYRIFVKD
jgi:hypothetical protein